MRDTNVLVADDHVIIRKGLKFIFDTHFKGCRITETDSVKTLLQLLSEQQFSHLVLDMQLLDANAMDVLARLRFMYPELGILIYTMSPEELFGRRVLQLGANGFLSKQSSEEEVIKALDYFLNGRKYISAMLHDILFEDSFKKASSNPLESLSERELSVLDYLLKGFGVKEISVTMDLKATTVATYKARIFDKLGVSNMMDLRNIAELYHFKGS